MVTRRFHVGVELRMGHSACCYTDTMVTAVFPLLVVHFSVARVQPRTSKGITDLLLLLLVLLDSQPVPVGVLTWGKGLAPIHEWTGRPVWDTSTTGRGIVSPKTTTW